tara:strand:+ start:1522 stop:2568 length:1047 start_codon:yes stop_codon:yes gene_type:complete
MSLGTGTIYEKDWEFDYKPDYGRRRMRITTPVFFFICNTNNYYHFLYDGIPYLFTYLELKKKNPDLKLLMNYPDETKSEFYRFVIELLLLLDITEDDIIIPQKHHQYRELYVGSSLTHDKLPNIAPRPEVYSMFKSMTHRVHKTPSPKKFYISRRTWMHNDHSNIGTDYTQKRKCVNEDAVVEFLEEQGFEEVFCENLTMMEKINYFRNAEHIVGASGGGMCNLLFANPECKVTNIVTPTFMDVNYRFKFSMDHTDITYLACTDFWETSKYKSGMRVRVGDRIGEIDMVLHDDRYLVSLRKIGTTGCDSTSNESPIRLHESELEAIDGGLNSPWIVDVEKLKEHMLRS